MATAMTLRGVIARDLSKKIEPVVKVYDQSTLLDDLQQFVITDSISRELRKFFDAFTESLGQRIRHGSGGDGMAVWVSGFFGSGKSHIAKVIGYLLENAVVSADTSETAIDIFSRHLDDPSVTNAGDLKASLAEIRTRAWCRTIAFDIKSKLDQANPDSVAVACLRQFYERLGLASTIWLARLERQIRQEGAYDIFLSIYREQTGRDWIEDRPAHGFYGEEIGTALAQTLGKSVDSCREILRSYQTDHSRVTPEGLIKEVIEYLDGQEQEIRPREPHLVFVIDEIGQFIGDNEDRIQELQSIVEQAGVQGRGRIWFICTSQEALDRVIDRTGIKKSLLGKLDARFSTRINLTGEDVRRVVQDRLLRKKQTSLDALGNLYKQFEGQIEELSRLRIERSYATISIDSVVKAYPFLPHVIPMVQDLFNAMRGFKLSGTERSMIGLVQGALNRLADEPVGVLAPLDLIFDQVEDELSSPDYLSSTGIKLIRESDDRLAQTPVPPSRVLKALWLIQRVEWIPRTPETIAKLIARQIAEDLPRLRDDIQTTLDALQRAGYVGRDEATGQYRYLSEEERGIEEAIIDAIREYGAGVAKRRVNDLLREKILKAGNKWDSYKIKFGRGGLISFVIGLDGERVAGSGEIQFDISGPLANIDFDDIEQRNTAGGRRGRTLWWTPDEDSTLVDRAKRLEALYKVLEQPRWRNDRSDETVRVVKEKEAERARLESSLVTQMEGMLRRGKVYYSGEVADLDGAKDLRGIAAEYISSVASHLYSQFAVADKAFDEKNLAAYLKPATKGLGRLDPALALFDAEGHLLLDGDLISTIFEELKRREDENEDLDGDTLIRHFDQIPYGWPEAIVKIVLAAMLRGGAIHLRLPDSDQPMYEIGDTAVDVFTKPQKFHRTRFYPTMGGLTPAEVRVAREGLIALGKTSVPDAAHVLAEQIRGLGKSMVEASERIRQRVQDLNLPLPDTYKRAEPITQAATAKRDPFACVRQFMADQREWQEIKAFLDAYDDFVANQRDRTFQDYHAILQLARECPEVFEGEEGARVKDQMQEYDAIVVNKAIMSEWKTLQDAALAVIGRYREVYRVTYEACQKAVTMLGDEVAESEAFQRLDEPRQEAVIAAFEPTLALPDSTRIETPEGLKRLSEQRSVSALNSLRIGIPGYRMAMFERIAREWGEQEAEHKPSAGPEVPEKKPVHINLHEQLAGRTFVSAQEFDKFWSELGDQIKAMLAQGIEVVVDA